MAADENNRSLKKRNAFYCHTSVIRHHFCNKIAPQTTVFYQIRTAEHDFRTKSHHRTRFSNEIAPQNIILEQNRTTEHLIFEQNHSTDMHFRTKSQHRTSFWNKITPQNTIFRTKSHRIRITLGAGRIEHYARQ